MDERLDLHDIIGLLRRRIGMIMLVMLGTAVLAGGITHYIMSPIYQSSTQILVSQEFSGGQVLTERDVQADLQLVSTYRELIESPVIMGKVIEQLGLNITVEELKDQLTVNSSAESQLIEIAVADKSQEKAVDIANTTAATFQEEVKNIMNVKNVKILFPAAVTDNIVPISSSPLFNMAVGAALGLILGIGLAFLLSYLDTSIKNEQDVEKYLEVPVLAVISPVEKRAGEEELKKVVLQEKEA